MVRGTNGKGTTATYLARALDSAGRRALLFTSPHLVTVRERARLGDAAIPAPTLAALEADLVAAEEAGRVPRLTYFEAITLHAARWGLGAGADAWVLEAGLGGPKDATAAFPSDLALLTPVGLDHEGELGNGLEEIARAKTADLAPGDLISAPQPAEAAGAVARLGPTSDTPAPPPGWEGRPSWLLDNLGLAMAGARSLGFDPAPPDPFVPGRLHRLRAEPGVMVDVAHNAAALRALGQACREGRGAPRRLVAGMGAGRLTPEALRALEDLGAAERAWCPLPIPWESAPCPAGWHGLETPSEALEWLGSDGIATGSTYLVGALLAAAGEEVA